MSPRGVPPSETAFRDVRWIQFLQETEGDPWWADEEAAIVEAARRDVEAAAAAQAAARPAAPGRPTATLFPGVLCLSGLPSGFRVVIDGVEWQPVRLSPLQRLGYAAGSWLVGLFRGIR